MSHVPPEEEKSSIACVNPVLHIEFSPSCTLFKCEILLIKNISHMVSDAERAASIPGFQTKAAQLATA